MGSFITTKKRIWSLDKRVREFAQHAVNSIEDVPTATGQKIFWLVIVSRGSSAELARKNDFSISASDESDLYEDTNAWIGKPNVPSNDPNLGNKIPDDLVIRIETLLKPSLPHIVGRVHDGSKRFSR